VGAGGRRLQFGLAVGNPQGLSTASRCCRSPADRGRGSAPWRWATREGCPRPFYEVVEALRARRNNHLLRRE
jgi:hypothetical protein